MEIPFALRGIPGHVRVAYGPDTVTRPGSGFPACHATVERAAAGYDAVLGWVQLVRSDDNLSAGREFEIDPLEFLGDLPHPFCWLGLNPQLYDAPWREGSADLDWESHSFLCVPDGEEGGPLEVHALMGFAWGFRLRAGSVELVPPRVLGPDDWDGHVVGLGARFPAWRFVTGFRSEGPGSAG